MTAVRYARQCGDAPIGKLTRTVIVSTNLVPIWMRSGYFYERGWGGGAIGLWRERAGVKSAFVGTELFDLLCLMNWTEMCHLLLFVTPFLLLYTLL